MRSLRIARLDVPHTMYALNVSARSPLQLALSRFLVTYHLRVEADEGSIKW